MKRRHNGLISFMEKKLYCSISRANKNHALFFVFNFLFHDFLPFIFFQIPFLSSSRRKMSFFRRNFVYRVSMICFSFFRFEIFSIVVIFFELLYFFQSKDLAVISFLYFLKVWSKFSCTQTPNSWFFKKKNGAKSNEIKWLVSYSNHHHQI